MESRGDQLNVNKSHRESVSPTPYPALSQQLLSKIDDVFSLVKKDSISTTQLSALLELLSKPCKFSHTVSQKLEFSLHEASVADLDNCDAAFKRFLENQAKVPLGSGSLQSGYQSLR